MTEQRKYKIGEMDYVVEELSIEQDKLIGEIIKELGAAFLVNMEINVLGIIDLLIEKNLLSRFMSIILIPAGGAFDKKHADSIVPLIDKMKSSAAVEAVEDFLSLNGAWVRKLIGFFPALQIPGRMMKTPASTSISG